MGDFQLATFISHRVSEKNTTIPSSLPARQPVNSSLVGYRTVTVPDLVASTILSIMTEDEG